MEKLLKLATASSSSQAVSLDSRTPGNLLDPFGLEQPTKQTSQAVQTVVSNTAPAAPGTSVSSQKRPEVKDNPGQLHILIVNRASMLTVRCRESFLRTNHPTIDDSTVTNF